jgi:hypothetical protein
MISFAFWEKPGKRQHTANMGIHIQDEAIEARIRAQCDTYGVPYHILHGTVASVPSGESSPSHFSSAQASLLLHLSSLLGFSLI